MISEVEKVLGGLFGLAIGDALGSIVEDSSYYDAEIEHGFLNNYALGGIYNLESGEVTENTYMAISTLKGILESKGDTTKCITKNYMEWFNSSPKNMGDFLRFLVGTFTDYKDMDKSKKIVSMYLNEEDYSRGFLPRALIPGIYYKNEEMAVKISKEQSLITNNKEYSLFCSSNYTKIAFKLFNGMNKMGMIDYLYEFPEFQIGELLKTPKKNLIVNGKMIDDLKTAFWCFINYESVEEIICEAVNLYGNSGTIASLAGGLGGIYYGASNIPKRWIDGLLIKESIEKLGNEVVVKKTNS